ncbi:hypothetical protein PYW08_004059 [Mythimna loreyi]|uniref:Uncharacterized protein n=1 Tax=Mythimna loreyi TaxID=667449 RepID=A0ACC2QUX1_9NEOP|nr:hypothetical protein PYW08_004059 [Mythimna loreyi]
MNLIIWVYLGLATWPEVFAIYYLKKEIFQPPKDRVLRNNSYFGYSITYEEFNKILIISSPRENDIGEVYTCSIEKQSCTPIDKKNILKRVSPKYTHDYWFGATVKAGPNFVTMCAPRYTVFDHDRNGYATNGKCYSYNAPDHLEERTQISKKDRIRDLGENLAYISIEKTMDSFGWSIDIAHNDTVIIGSPGMFHGRAMIYDETISYKDPILFDIFNKQITNPPEFNFGYAVASGKFINNDLSYAISSPYGFRGHGQVLFYKERNLPYVGYIENSSPIGSMFGGVLCAAKFSVDGTDLLVGAPTYATKDTYNLGAVYVYLAANKTLVFHKIIIGKVSGSMFGSAIVSVGDLNGDEKDEIAIGAPFENDGVVYLYSGADLCTKKSEKDLKYLQRIEAEKSYGESFGMSLTPLLDYDNNGCKELAIGSPYKNTVVLLRCMAAITVETLKPKFPNLQIRNSTQTDFEFEVCLTVKYPTLPQKINEVLSTTVDIEHESAKLLHPNDRGLFTYQTSLIEKQPKYCKNISLFLPKDSQYETKIRYTISSKLLNEPGTLTDFNSSRVILSDLSVLSQHDSVWASECAGHEICLPSLTLTPYISFHHDDDLYIIGTSNKGTEFVTLTVHNDGEVAYEPCVRVHIIGVNVLRTPIGCKHKSLTEQNKLICEPPKPIRTNKTWIIDQIVLEMTHLTNLDKNVTINMFLFNHCKNGLTNSTSITIPVKADPRGISAKGETDVGSIVKMANQDIEENGKHIQHIYTITNKGPTNWKNLEAHVTLQTKPYIQYGDISVTVYYPTSNVYSACRLAKEESVSYVCLIESLAKDIEYAKIHIPMYILPGTLGGIFDKDKNCTINSSVNLTLTDDNSKVESIITTITFQEIMPVSIETIIIAVVVGICIIVIIVLILYWGGFLRRKKREELNELKKQVKRQTILRRSTMQTQPPQENETELRISTIEENQNDDTEDSKQA